MDINITMQIAVKHTYAIRIAEQNGDRKYIIDDTFLLLKCVLVKVMELQIFNIKLMVIGS